MNFKTLYKIIALMIIFMGALFLEEATVNATSEQTSIILEDQENLNIEKATVAMANDTYEYTGNSIEPDIEVYCNNNRKLVKDVDYEIIYINNIDVGTASLYIKGIGDYYGNSTPIEFSIVPVNISNATVLLEYSNYKYQAKEIKPKPTVKLNDKILVVGVDYKIEYKNNKYPGTARITISGINNYRGNVVYSFDIAKITGLKIKSTGTKSVTLIWEKRKDVTGYKIYKYNDTKKKWSLYKTIKKDVNTCQIKNLTPGDCYNFRVKTYVKKNEKIFNGTSTEILVPIKPNKVILNNIKTDAKLKANISWKKSNSSGYELRVSSNSSFSTYTKYTITSYKSVSKTITDLENGKYYYAKVRAYREYGNRTVYGKWSDVKKVRATNSGWVTDNGKRFYYKNGKPLKGKQKIGGEYYYFETEEGMCAGASASMWNKVKNATSNTNKLVAVSRKLNRTCVYYRVGNNWAMQKSFLCTTGAPQTPSPRLSVLTPELRSRKLSFGDGATYTCWYATRIKGNVYFHSVLHSPGSATGLYDGRLGRNLSHGCIRLARTNAKWIYDNISSGTRVIIY